MVNWNTITLPKQKGGRGVQTISLKNDSLLCSLAWRFHTTPSPLWVQLLTKKYSNTTHGTYPPSSPIWKNIQRSVSYIRVLSTGLLIMGASLIYGITDGSSHYPLLPLFSLIQGLFSGPNPLPKLASQLSNDVLSLILFLSISQLTWKLEFKTPSYLIFQLDLTLPVGFFLAMVPYFVELPTSFY